MPRLFAALFLAISILGCASLASARIEPPRAEAGILNLEGWAVEDRGALGLDGAWEFYWHRLLTPADFARHATPVGREWGAIPQTWTRYQHEGRPLPGDGYATFRLTIRDPGARGVRGLYLPPIRTAYRLWVNGELTAANGVVGTARDSTVPRYRTQAVFFQPNGDTVELVLQVANFHHRAGGLPNPLVYGTADQITTLHEHRVAVSLFLFGSLVIMGLYQLNFHARYRADRSTLYFGIYCLLVSLWTVLVREASLTRWFPALPWELGMKLEYLAIYAGLPVFTLFLRAIYPREVSERATSIVVVLGSLFSLLVAATPARVYTQTLPAFQAVMVLSGLYLLYALFLAAVRKRTNSWLSCLAGLVFTATVYHDIALVNGLTATGELSPMGLLFFVFAQALNLSGKYASTFAATEKMSAELQELNRNLEEKVAERTLSLERSQRQVAETLAAVSVLQERERLARTIHNSVGHTLTTTTVLIEAAKRLMVRNTEGAQEKLEQSLELTRKGLNEMRQTVHALKDPPREMDLALSLAQLIQKTSHHTNITVDAEIEPLDRVTPAQSEVLFHAVQEGLTNGIRHGGSTHFRVSLHQNDGAICLAVADNGKGARSPSFGFGLQTLQDRVESLDGALSVAAEPGQGITLSVILPVHADE